MSVLSGYGESFAAFSQFFINFYHLERCEELNPLSARAEIVLFALCVPPTDNYCTGSLYRRMESHAITTENSKTPLQLFAPGTIARSVQLVGLSRQRPTGSKSPLADISGGVVPTVNCPLTNDKKA